MTAKIVGGATGARTPDLLHAMQALFQLSYSPAVKRQYSSGPGSIRRAVSGGRGWFLGTIRGCQCQDDVRVDLHNPGMDQPS